VQSTDLSSHAGGFQAQRGWFISHGQPIQELATLDRWAIVAASGARMVTTLTYGLARRGGDIGVAANVRGW
jgi:hypothetical protein